MPPRPKRKVASILTDITYNFALGEHCVWCGELTYSVKNEAAMFLWGESFSSISSISIFPTLISATSKKLKSNNKIEIKVLLLEEAKFSDEIGIIEKSKNNILFYLGLPWNIANHLHMILISKMAKSLTLSGTDIYRNKGSIYGIEISNDYENYL